MMIMDTNLKNKESRERLRMMNKFQLNLSKNKNIKPIQSKTIKKIFLTQLYNDIGSDILEVLNNSGVTPDNNILINPAILGYWI